MLDGESTRANTGSRSNVTFYRLSQAREAGASGLGLVSGPLCGFLLPYHVGQADLPDLELGLQLAPRAPDTLHPRVRICSLHCYAVELWQRPSPEPPGLCQ
jgi:hypothetical protein